ncbi:MAG: phosphoglycerate kinase [Pseudomonadota bacterium]
MSLVSVKDVDLHQKRVIIREDLNVPMKNGYITSDARIQAVLPTLQYLLEQGAAVIVLSHLNRPEEGHVTPEFSLTPVAKRLQTLLGCPVRFIADWIDGIEIVPGEIVLCENVRFQRGEKKNDPVLAKKIAGLGDIFVMDAFASAHRNEASTVGVAQFAPQACAGLLLIAELNALTQALQNPARPLLAIVGGSKVSSKLQVLDSLLHKVDTLIVGGGIANTFLAAQGYKLGRSLVETGLLEGAHRLIAVAQRNHVEIVLPIDVIVAKEISITAKTHIRNLTEIASDEMVLDMGPESIKLYKQSIVSAATILWNGPIGVFEVAPFEKGTLALSLAIANSNAFSIAGGGDTLAAIEKYAISDKISYISTGGGAFLEFVEGKTFPVLQVLQERARGQ